MTKRITKRTQINQHYHQVKYGKEKGLYANIHAKRKRIKKGSKEKMRKPGTKGAPTKKQFKRAAKTAKRRKK